MKSNRCSAVLDSSTDENSEGRPAKKAKTWGQSSYLAASVAPPSFLEELIEPVLAQLSIPQLGALKQDSKLWASMLQTPSLRRACAAAHPKVFGLVGWAGDAMWTTLYDVKANEWVDTKLTEFPEEKEYEDAMYASDGGLVCFVPRTGEKLAALPILVYNPLTNDRKCIPKGEGCPFGKRKLILVQLVKDEDTKSYKVILVYGDTVGAARGAIVYDSRAGLWSKMNAGLVFGAGNTLLCGQQDPHAFDCLYEVLYSLKLGVVPGAGPRSFSSVKDHLFMLDDNTTPGKFKLYEYIWTPEVLRESKTSSGLSEEQEYHPVLLVCSNFILLAWDNDNDDEHDQMFKLYDIAGKEYSSINTDSRTTLEVLQNSLVCDLRWDATP